MAEALDRFNFQTEDDLYAAVGYGEISAQVVFNRLTEKERKEQEIERQKQEAEELMSQPVKKESDRMKVRHEGGIVIQGLKICLFESVVAVILYQAMKSSVTLQKVGVFQYTELIVQMYSIKKNSHNV